MAHEIYGTSDMAQGPGDTGYLHPKNDIQIQAAGNDDYLTSGRTIPRHALKHRIFYFAEGALTDGDWLDTGIPGIVATAWQSEDSGTEHSAQLRCTDATLGRITVQCESEAAGYVHIWSVY